jgi:hypothetical protein
MLYNRYVAAGWRLVENLARLKPCSVQGSVNVTRKEPSLSLCGSRDRLAKSLGHSISEDQFITLRPALVSTGASFRISTSPMLIKSRRSC